MDEFHSDVYCRLALAETPRQMIPVRASTETVPQPNFDRQAWTLWQAAVTVMTLLHFLQQIPRGSITPWQTTIMTAILLHFLRRIPRNSSIRWQVATTDAAPLPSADSMWHTPMIATGPLHYSLQQTSPDPGQPTTRRLQISLSGYRPLRL